MYVCGPTVYGHSHAGHAKSYVSFDVIVRYLRASGYAVRYVQNITDVGHLTDDADEGEDKIEKQSKKDRVHPMQIAEAFTRSYLEDMDALNVLRADIAPRATGHIIEQIETGQGPDRARLRLRGQRVGLFRRVEGPGIRQALEQERRRGRGGHARGAEIRETQPERLRPLEEGGTGAHHAVAEPVGDRGSRDGTSSARRCR